MDKSGIRKILVLLLIGAAVGASGGAYAALSGSTSSGGNTFSAAASFGTCPATGPSATWLTGMEHGVVSTSGGGLFEYGVGASAVSSPARTGSYALRLTATGSGAYVGKSVSGSTLVMRFAIRFNSLPSANVNSLASSYVTAGTNLMLGYRASDQRLTLTYGAIGANSAASGSPIAANTWYVIDMRAQVGSNPRTGDWRIDGVAQPSVSSAETAASNTLVGLGSNATETFTAYYDDILASTTAADYPIGGGLVRALRPDSVGTHDFATNFRHEDGTAIDGTSWNRLTETPMDSSAASVQQRTASGSSSLAFNFADPADTCIRAVSAVLAYHSSGNGGNNGKTSIFDGSVERNVFSGDMGGTTLGYKSTVIPPDGTGWTKTELSGLVGRVGYATDVNPIPMWDALMLEYEATP